MSGYSDSRNDGISTRMPPRLKLLVAASAVILMCGALEFDSAPVRAAHLKQGRTSDATVMPGPTKARPSHIPPDSALKKLRKTRTDSAAPRAATGFFPARWVTQSDWYNGVYAYASPSGVPESDYLAGYVMNAYIDSLAITYYEVRFYSPSGDWTGSVWHTAYPIGTLYPETPVWQTCGWGGCTYGFGDLVTLAGGTFLNCGIIPPGYPVPPQLGTWTLVLYQNGTALMSTPLKVVYAPSCHPSPSPSPTPPPPSPTPPPPSPSPSPTPSPSPSPTPPTTPPAIGGPQGCINDITPTINWGDVPGATSYELFVLNAYDQFVVHEEPSDSYYAIPPGTIGEGLTYHWNARGKNSAGNGPVCDFTYFTPFCQAPTPSVPSGCVATGTPTFAWDGVDGAQGYRVTVTSADTGLQVLNASTPSTTYTASAEVFGPPPAGQGNYYWPRYNWVVRATYPAGYEGPASAPKEFTPRCNPDAEQTEVPEEEEVEERPVCGPCETWAPSVPPGNASLGGPVSVVTGNVYLDQTDLVVPGITGIAFTRSYNSNNLQEGRYGIFGPGWSHPYERSLSFPYADILELRQSNGAVRYFRDLDRAGRFEAAVPVTEQSTVVRQTDGSFVREFRGGDSERYDASGHLTAIVNRIGHVTTLVHGTNGRLESIVDQGGRTVTLTYADDKLTRVAAPGELEYAAYTYDAEDRLETVTYADGSGYRFTYEDPGRLLTVKDQAGNTLESHTYHPDGRGWTSSISDGQENYTLVYDTNQTTVTDALGNVTTYDYEEQNQIKRVARITGPCATCGGGGGEVQEWTYDSSGRVTLHRDGAANVTHYEYDPNTGDLVFVKDALLRTTIYTYWPDGRIKTRTGPDGSSTYISYVPAGPSETVERIGPEETRTTRIKYGPEGRPIEVVDARGKLTKYTYYPSGDLETVTDPLGRVTTYGYDDMGRLRWVRDHLQRRTWTEYDGRGRVKKVTAPDDTFATTAYDLAGRPTTVTDRMGRITRYGYDPYGRLSAAVDPLWGATRYDYDLMSRTTGLTDAEGRTTAFEYDGYGRPVGTVYPGSGITHTTYDTAGRVASHTDRNGVVSTMAYDPVGHLIERRFSDATPSSTYKYDAAGRMVEASNATDTLTWTYDLLGRVLTESSQRNGSTIRYTYDDAGNRLTLSIGEDGFAQYAYNNANQLVSITRGTRTFGFGYEDPDRPGVLRLERMLMTYPNGVTTTYAYDDLSRLTTVKALHDTTTISDLSYEHDDAGNRTKKTSPETIEDYGYDAVDRLVSVTRPNRAEGFTYDRVGNRTSRDVDGALFRSSVYDVRNQLVEEKGGGPVLWRGELYKTPEEGGGPDQGTVTFSRVMANDVSARMVSTNVFEAVLEMAPGVNYVTVNAWDASGNLSTHTYAFDTGTQAISYEHDANGNRVHKTAAGEEWVYEWDGDNRLTRVTRGGTELAHFTYDPLGRRVEKVAGGVTYSYLYDGLDVLRETRSDGPIHWYVHGPGIDEPLARVTALGDPNETWVYYHADGLGSIVRLTDSAGAAVKSFDYDAWGNIQCPEADPPCADEGGYRFTGREWDPEIGLYYYRARYYDSSMGRFISEDPIGLAGGLNEYQYVGAQPTGRIDPFGRDWLTTTSSLVSGFGDSLTFGGTTWASNRVADYYGISETPDPTNRCGVAYNAGQAAGTLWWAAAGGALGGPTAASELGNVTVPNAMYEAALSGLSASEKLAALGASRALGQAALNVVNPARWGTILQTTLTTGPTAAGWGGVAGTVVGVGSWGTSASGDPCGCR